jgi:hypothetical protein
MGSPEREVTIAEPTTSHSKHLRHVIAACSADGQYTSINNSLGERALRSELHDREAAEAGLQVLEVGVAGVRRQTKPISP